MGLKKGVFFIIDSIIGGTIILVMIMLASTFYVKEQSNFHLNYLAQDLITILSSLNVKEVDNPYINSLINDGTITNLDNSVLEQIGEFWAEDNIILANKSASNVTELLMPDYIGFGIWMNNETIYKRDLPIKKSLVSSKKMISGIEKGQTNNLPSRSNPPTLWGPVIAEVRVWE